MMARTKPMSRGTKGLRRTAFKPKAAFSHNADSAPPERSARLEARADRALNSGAFTAAMRTRLNMPPAQLAQGLNAINPIASIQSQPATFSKDGALRSEAYRRAVSLLPCIYCGIVGYSQHAHANEGKGMGLKVDDRRGFPLCCSRPGVEGCHAAFDQYHLLAGGREAHREAADRWAARTRAVIRKVGRWPRNLPSWDLDVCCKVT